VYDSNNTVTLSDHRPVFAQFMLTFDLYGEGFGKVAEHSMPDVDDPFGAIMQKHVNNL